MILGLFFAVLGRVIYIEFCSLNLGVWWLILVCFICFYFRFVCFASLVVSVCCCLLVLRFD